jgi:hypothetical protein
MIPEEKNTSPPNFGSWQEAEDLRKWSFLQRSPQQRLDWLVQALSLAYECGALENRAENRQAAQHGALK